MINGPSEIYVELSGRIERAWIRLESDAQILHLIERVIGPLGLRIDESQPYVEARLPDGSRPACDHPAAVDSRPGGHHPPVSRRSRSPTSRWSPIERSRPRWSASSIRRSGRR